MSEAVTFEKWEGLGNDFILLPRRELRDDQVRALCDRRLGIGADGVLLIEAGAPPRMIVRNADGSRPEMCGNGLRCVAGYLARGEKSVVVATDAGDRPCVVVPREGGGFDVEVDMGLARIGPDDVVPFEGRELRFATIDMGNPHAVTFDPFSAPERDRIGPHVERRPPAGTNVEFAAMLDGPDPGIGLVVWERGVGYTRACGTGACATVVAACRQGRVPFAMPVRVELPGGVLHVEVDSEPLRVRMRGPARRSFTGVVQVD